VDLFLFPLRISYFSFLYKLSVDSCQVANGVHYFGFLNKFSVWFVAALFIRFVFVFNQQLALLAVIN